MRTVSGRFPALMASCITVNLQRWCKGGVQLLASEKQEALGSGPGTQWQGFSPGGCA